MVNRVTSSHSYEEALSIMCEYVTPIEVDGIDDYDEYDIDDICI